jgi:DNA/RNA endonuclease G (NUC1)
MPNESKHHRIQEYALTVNELEEKIGLDLFPNIDDSIEEMIETDLYFSFWNL